MRESFLRDVERTLLPGGSLHFWTDVEEYFQTRWNCSPRTRRCWARCRCPKPAEHDMAYRTHFERRVARPARAGVSGGVQEGRSELVTVSSWGSCCP